MEKSAFQFSNPRVVNLEFTTNNDFIKDQFNGFAIVSEITNVIVEDNREAFVRLDLTIGEKSREVPFECKIGMMAKFKVEQEVMPDDFQNFLDVNAPALLMSYTRPIVSFVASQAGFSSFNIPFMNFTGN